jgi:peptide/nickel transport system substrate-binding protein
LAPTSQEQLEWPKWGQYFETKGRAGEAPDLPAAIWLGELYDDWLGSASTPAQTGIWRRMLQIWAEQVFSIGTVGGVLQPVVVADRLRNVPEKGIYNWDPGAYFGIYKPDQFWFEEPVTREQSASAGAAPAAPR